MLANLKCRVLSTCLVCSLIIATPSPGQMSAEQARPNIVLINLDDADADLLTDEMLEQFYPNIGMMAANGLRFTNMHVTTPFCGPSRAALFRGQYAFNTGIKVNTPDNINSNGFTGGYGEFLARGHHEDELGVWMKSVGYRTMHVGKYHHHHFNGQIPPGWDDFRVALGANYYAGFRFSNENHPDGQYFQTGPDDYLTTVDGDYAVELIQQQTGNDQPFFLYVASVSPHMPTSAIPEDMVELQYQDFASEHSMPYSPDLFESDTSDKPPHLRIELQPNNMQIIQRTYISRVRAIKSVDDMVGRIYSAIEQAGFAESTYVFFTSDNGFQNGHHNLRGKSDPFHRTTNVPLFVTGPNIATNQNADHLLAHIDLCPTILNLAQSAIPPSVEAQSFFPLLFDPDEFDEQTWQDGIMIENWSNRSQFGRRIQHAYTAYRSHHEIVVSWANGEFEYYNLEHDPYQLNNSFHQLPVSQRQSLKRKIRIFRQNATQPITTIDQRFSDRLQNRNVKLRGYAEDNRGVLGTQVSVQSATTQRYWNGETWQEAWFAHSVNPRNRNQPISIWNFKTKLETETPSGLDMLIFNYRSVDATNQYPSVFSSHANEVDGLAPIATFAEYDSPVPVFSGPVVLNGSYFDGVEFDRASMTIRQIGTNLYFNGDGFQENRFEIPTVLVSDEHWKLNVELPPATYVAGVKGFDAAGNRQHPASLLRFKVVQ